MTDDLDTWDDDDFWEDDDWGLFKDEEPFITKEQFGKLLKDTLDQMGGLSFPPEEKES